MNHGMISTDAILLTKRSFGDGHINLCLLTKDYGLIRASAFGGQRLSKRFKGGLDYFQVFEAELQKTQYQNQPMFNIACIKSIKKRFLNISNSLEKYISVSYIQELASILLTPSEIKGKNREPYFDFLVNTLETIDNSSDKDKILDVVYESSIALYKDTGFLANVNCVDSTNSKLCHLEHFNCNILEKTPKSFSLLANTFSSKD